VNILAAQGGYTQVEIYGKAGTNKLEIVFDGGGVACKHVTPIRKDMRVKFVAQYGGGTVSFTPLT
jgi:hypothetical protein